MMVMAEAVSLSALFHADETAWLDAMAELAAQGQVAHLDCHNLGEYLTDMARRDRREVFSRLVALLAHILKWEYQPERRTGSWRATLREQRRELRQLFESATLRKHAANVFAEAYAEARLQAADEIEVDPSAFPLAPPSGVDDVLEEREA